MASGTPATSVRKGGLPSLEIIEKRFASKLSKEVINGASDAVSSPTDKYAPIAGNEELSPPGESSSVMARSKSEGSSPAPLPSNEVHRPTPATKAESATAVPSHGREDAAAAATSTTSTEKSWPDKSKPESRPANADMHPDAPASSTSSAHPAGVKSEEHPLQHDWTLYYDSRATARAAQLAQLAVAGKAQAQARADAASGAPGTPLTAAPGSTKDGVSSSGSGTAYEAGLTAIGTFGTVQAFCRLHNWTKRPSRMGLNENVHLFKDGIRPMWEDERNKHGGKWVLQVENGRKEEIDRFWTWLCLALVRLSCSLILCQRTAG